MPRSRTIDLRWNALLNDFRRSGLTQAEFCRQRKSRSLPSEITSTSRSRPNPPPATIVLPPVPTIHFLPVTILPDPILSITASQPHLELILSNGRRIAVAPGFDPQTLRRLIAVVEERPCSD